MLLPEYSKIFSSEKIFPVNHEHFSMFHKKR